jgi:methyltransferase of ATP-grasp peptide maturase system
MSTLETDLETAAARARAGLVERLAPAGVLRDPALAAAAAAVPRHRFVPGFYLPGPTGRDGLTRWEPVTARTDPRRWLDAVYTDQTLITQFDGADPDWQNPAVCRGGAPSSSSTLPSLVLRMLDDLQLHDGARVLEIGTGTGYSTALLAHRLGEHLVTSVEVDPVVAARAAGHLAAAGYSPELVTGDGLAGHQAHAPYDRIIATCSVRALPAAWLEQTAPGAIILVPLTGRLYAAALARLTVTGPGTARGRLLPGTVSFMPARAQAAPPPAVLPNPADAAQRPSLVPASALEDWTGRWIAQLAAPDAITFGLRDPDGRMVAVVHEPETGSTAWLDGDQVAEAGPRGLWARIEQAHQEWTAAGSPAQDEFTVEVDAAGQRVRHPRMPCAFALPG